MGFLVQLSLSRTFITQPMVRQSFQRRGRVTKPLAPRGREAVRIVILRRQGSSRAVSRSVMSADVTVIIRGRSRVSTAGCLLRPLIFFPASHPRVLRVTVETALTDCEFLRSSG